MALDLHGLIERGLIAPDRARGLQRVADQFAVALTDDIAELIDPNDPVDPIAAQFLPREAELDVDLHDRADPIGDHRWSPVPGIVHRYPDRVLLKPVLVCPVYCRFCFRREQVGGDDGMLPAEALDRAFTYIEQHPDIWEVIITGGDPFVLSPRRLAELVRRLEAVPHVAVIRFHTRVPIAEPRRIAPPLVAALQSEKAIYVVIHANHPRELTPAVREAVGRLVKAGIPTLAQSVLLRGVNDNPEVLEALFRALVAIRVKPYYLHHPDLAPGTAHFRLGIEEGQRLVAGLRGRVSGLCQPTYVLDIPGGFGKVPVAAGYTEPRKNGGWIVRDAAGGEHPYPPPGDDTVS
ncbi:MAG: lysine-2,3-aminomutase-like protein [Alphaproteobacteria bacterium]|nr:lysine-2,3-aminomutase-like protein [Alphaproteobacteria bacterium]